MKTTKLCKRFHINLLMSFDKQKIDTELLKKYHNCVNVFTLLFKRK